MTVVMALVFAGAVLLSGLGVGMAAAGTSGVQFANDDGSGYTAVTDGSATTVDVTVTADADGLTDQPVDLVVVQNGEAVTSLSKTVSPAADSSETVSFELNPSEEGLSPGDYDLDANVNGTAERTSLTVEEPPAEPSVSGVSNDTIVKNGSTMFSADLAATDGSSYSGPAEITVADADGNMVYTDTVDPVNVSAGETGSVEFEINESDIDGNVTIGDEYDVGVSWGEYNSEPATLTVQEEGALAGAISLPADSPATDPVFIGGVLAVLAFLGLAAKAE